MTTTQNPNAAAEHFAMMVNHLVEKAHRNGITDADQVAGLVKGWMLDLVGAA